MAKLEAGSYGLDPRPGRVNNFLFGCYVLDPRPGRVNNFLFGCYVWSHGRDELTTFLSDGYTLPAAPAFCTQGGWRARLEASSYGLDPRPGRVNDFLFGCYVWSHGRDELTTFPSDGYALPAALTSST